MDEVKYCEIRTFLKTHNYPDGYDKSKKRVFRRLCERFVSENGKLFYIGKGEKHLVVKGAEKAHEIFRESHCSPLGGHSGINKTKLAICSRFYWPSMTLDIKKWVTECHHCQSQLCRSRMFSEKKPVQISDVWELVDINLIGPLPTTLRENKYIFTATDYISKFVDAFPHKTESPEEVAGSLMKIFLNRGCPKRIHSNRGQEFVDEINSGLCKLLNVNHWIIVACQEQTNELDERANPNLESTFSQCVSEHHDDWDDYVASAVYSVVTTPNSATEVSPFFLMYNRHAREPSDSTSVDLDMEIVLPSQEDYRQYIKKTRKGKKATPVQREDNIKPKKRKLKENNILAVEMQTQDFAFNAGDLVLLTI